MTISLVTHGSVASIHWNKQHWNTVTLTDNLDAALWQGWIEHSYQRVVAGLPKAKRPQAPTGDPTP